jgi:hypothetical protein
MAYATFEDYERLARTNEDRFEQIEVELNRALELIDEDNVEKAKARVDQAAHMAGEGVRLNLVATQK